MVDVANISKKTTRDDDINKKKLGLRTKNVLLITYVRRSVHCRMLRIRHFVETHWTKERRRHCGTNMTPTVYIGGRHTLWPTQCPDDLGSALCDEKNYLSGERTHVSTSEHNVE